MEFLAGFKDLIGFILPPAIDFVNRHIANTTVRFLVSLLICVVVAVVINYEIFVSGDYNDLLGKIGIIFTEAQLIYKTYWANSRARVAVYGRGILS
jgi:hypothetical protein